MQIEMSELAALVTALNGQKESPLDGQARGQTIVVATHGHVLVGDLFEEGDRFYLRKASVIRVWGTTKGLGELRDGPTESTKLDPCGDIVIQRHAVIFTMPCRGF